MKFTVSKSTDVGGDNDYEVEIDSLDDLKKIQSDNAVPTEKYHWKNPPLIIDFNSKTIEIYNFYRE